MAYQPGVSIAADGERTKKQQVYNFPYFTNPDYHYS
jgi:hypothetical protein